MLVQFIIICVTASSSWLAGWVVSDTLQAKVQKLPPKEWPARYGVFGKDLPEGIVRQHLYPLRKAEPKAPVPPPAA
ncbi:hypothetical protein [Pseudomonas sp. 2835]|uniref:hypothetical protein n=1 Tax=Pseudomonas sp. 2835 TaxID=3156451 RepID=UPI003D22E3C7